MYWVVTIAVVLLINTLAYITGAKLGDAELGSLVGNVAVIAYVWYRFRRRPRAA